MAARRDAGPGGAGRRRAATALVLALAFLLAGTSSLVATTLEHRSIRSDRGEVMAFSPNLSVLPRIDDVPALLAKVLPSVVGVRNVLASGSTPNCAAEGFAGGVAVDEGTGIVLTAAGEVLTNNHVVAGGTGISVTLEGGRSYPATVVGADPADDLALLQVHGAPPLSPITLGSSSAAQVGESVLAVGNALGLSLASPSVSEGILSARGRVVTAAVSCTDETLLDMLQTDAAINPGNSGGPLLDAEGQVIGIDTAAAGGTSLDPAQRVGFAIPIDDVLALLPGLRRGGAIGEPKAYLGVEAETLTPLLRRQFGYAPPYGAVIDSVVPGSPAALAGLEPGDVVVSFGPRKVTSAAALSAAVGSARPGTRLSVSYYRGAQLRSVPVLLTVSPAPA